MLSLDVPLRNLDALPTINNHTNNTQGRSNCVCLDQSAVRDEFDDDSRSQALLDVLQVTVESSLHRRLMPRAFGSLLYASGGGHD